MLATSLDSPKVRLSQPTGSRHRNGTRRAGVRSILVMVAIACAACHRRSNDSLTHQAAPPPPPTPPAASPPPSPAEAPRPVTQLRSDGTFADDGAWRARRDGYFKVRSISEIPDIYRTDKIRYSLPRGWVALRPEYDKQPYVQAGPAVPENDEAAATFVQVYRPIIHGAPKGLSIPPLDSVSTLPENIAFGSLLIEAKAAGGTTDPQRAHQSSTFLPSGLRLYEAASEIHFPNGGGTNYVRCGVIEADHELLPLCAHGPGFAGVNRAAQLWLDTIRPGDGVIPEHVIRYGGYVSYLVPNSWTAKVIGDGKGIQWFPDGGNANGPPGEHAANASIYLPTVWHKTAREYFDRFTEKLFSKNVEHEIIFKRESASIVVAKMEWNKEQLAGGHQALCVTTVEHELAQIACFTVEDDAALKKYGEAGQRFIQSVSVRRETKDEAPRRPSSKLPSPVFHI